MEEIATGTFRRWHLKEFVRLHACKERSVRRALRGPGAIVVEAHLSVLAGPGVHQAIAGAAIETPRRFAGLENGEVGDAADIDDDTGLAPAAMSRERKSATTLQPVSSANNDGLLSCTVKPMSGRWRTVWP